MAFINQIAAPDSRAAWSCALVHVHSFRLKHVCLVRTDVTVCGVSLELEVGDYRKRGNRDDALVYVCMCVSIGRQYYSWATEVQPTQMQNISTHIHRYLHTQVPREMTPAWAHHRDLCWGTDRGDWSLQCIVRLSDREVESILFQFPYLQAELWPRRREMSWRKMKRAEGEKWGERDENKSVEIKLFNCFVLFLPTRLLACSVHHHKAVPFF